MRPPTGSRSSTEGDVIAEAGGNVVAVDRAGNVGKQRHVVEAAQQVAVEAEPATQPHGDPA